MTRCKDKRESRNKVFLGEREDQKSSFFNWRLFLDFLFLSPSLFFMSRQRWRRLFPSFLPLSLSLGNHILAAETRKEREREKKKEKRPSFSKGEEVGSGTNEVLSLSLSSLSSSIPKKREDPTPSNSPPQKKKIDGRDQGEMRRGIGRNQSQSRKRMRPGPLGEGRKIEFLRFFLSLLFCFLE